MKLVLKIVGIILLTALGFGAFLYFDSLYIEGEPRLSACWAVEFYDDVTGEKVVGAEDLDFDPETGTIFISAYDRRAVAREIDEGKVKTQGGIYTLNVSDITDAPSLKVSDITQYLKSMVDFRPHGISLERLTGQLWLYVINRGFRNDGQKIIVESEIISMQIINGSLIRPRSLVSPSICHANDLVSGPGKLLITNDRVTCEAGFGKPETGSIQGYEAEEFREFFGDLAFPNGITLFPNKDRELAVALTGDSAIKIFSFAPNTLFDPASLQETRLIELPFAPDNLTVDEDNNLYVAGFSNLLDYYFYMQGWLGVKKSPSAVYRISPEDYSQELLFADDGDVISGATVALRAGDYLILGSAWDDNIAICSGMDGLD